MTITASSGHRSAAPPTSGRTGALVTLAAGIAILVSSEFLPAGVLPVMARDLGISEGIAGLAVSATAIAGALTAPSIALVLPRTDRRTVLAGLLFAAAVSNLAVAVTPSFWLLLVARVVLGVAIAGFWSFAFGAGVYVSPGRDHAVSAWIAVGGTIATIVGVPLGAWLADGPGWRWGFSGATALSLLTAVTVLRTLPPLPAHPSAGLTMMRAALTNRRLMAGVLLVVIVVLGNFLAYPFIRVAIAERGVGHTMWLLVLWGVGGLVGNIAAGRLASRLRGVVASAPLLLAIGLVTAIAAEDLWMMALAMLVWGIAMNMVPVGTQLWVTRAEPARAESALALQVTAFQLAIMLGAAVGGAVLDAYGVQWVLSIGAAVALAAAAGFGAIRPQPVDLGNR